MARDKIHDAVRRALEKAGWEVTDDPFPLRSGNVQLDIDMAVEQLVIAERRFEKIMVEVKTLQGRSLINDFHTVVGQYVNYRGALRDEGIDRDIYLAISEGIWRQLSNAPFYLRRIDEFKIKVLVVNIIYETIVRWIK